MPLRVVAVPSRFGCSSFVPAGYDPHYCASCKDHESEHKKRVTCGCGRTFTFPVTVKAPPRHTVRAWSPFWKRPKPAMCTEVP